MVVIKGNCIVVEKGFIATKLQLSCNELHHIYSESNNSCNSCNLSDNTHNVEI